MGGRPEHVEGCSESRFGIPGRPAWAVTQADAFYQSDIARNGFLGRAAVPDAFDFKSAESHSLSTTAARSRSQACDRCDRWAGTSTTRNGIDCIRVEKRRLQLEV